MIAQTLAIEHPRRVRTLTSIMSTTGNPALPPPNPEAIAFLLSPMPMDRAGAIEYGVKMFRTIGSPDFPFEEERVRRLAALAVRPRPRPRRRAASAGRDRRLG